VFFSDRRYEARAKALVTDADIVIYKDKLQDVLGEHLGGVARLGFEAQSASVAERDALAEALGNVELVPTKAQVETLRRFKDEGEVAAIRRAVEVADAGFSYILERLSAGRSEREVALDLEVFMRTNGAEDVSFDLIVASGPLSAHIHHTASERVLEKGDLVLLDFGARVDGYCSDCTRTVVLGPASDEQQALYELVLAAQLAGIGAIAPGVACRDVDAAARKVIAEAGYGDAFGHGLGHGVGLDIHEEPRFNEPSIDVLAGGEVMTVEPGVYLPGRGGIRIEDCVLVTDGGPEVLTGAPKDRLVET
jgi:Xaa-Pro aminopeptidase